MAKLAFRNWWRLAGSLRHYNATTGIEWLTRIQDRCRHVVWLNPVPEQAWPQSPSLALIQNAMAAAMHPLTPAGLTKCGKGAAALTWRTGVLAQKPRTLSAICWIKRCRDSSAPQALCGVINKFGR